MSLSGQQGRIRDGASQGNGRSNMHTGLDSAGLQQGCGMWQLVHPAVQTVPLLPAPSPPAAFAALVPARSELELLLACVAQGIQVCLHRFVHGPRPAAQHQNVGAGGGQVLPAGQAGRRAGGEGGGGVKGGTTALNTWDPRSTG